jgi:hypothetical protein
MLTSPLNAQLPYVGQPTNFLREGLGSSSASRTVTRELLFFMFGNSVEVPLWKIESKVT